LTDEINNTNSRGRGRPLGFRLSETSKQAISDSKKGQHHSESTKEKISKALTGRKKPKGHGDKIAEINRNRIFTEEHRKNISNALKGKKP
jgi:hypothetical protein